ncbi:MAG TPA: ATP-binding protein [Stellaceae bacterium]|jgi:signal transduction histidine kinase|nr:ATP-binding protein [Stellaceae bacterium]
MPDDLILGNAPGILIVDDDRDFAESLVDLLVAQGYETQIADRPETAIAAVASSDVAVVMLDIRLGVTSGVDLMSRLKAERPDLICVLMTAHIDTQTAIKALRQGAYDYCDKACEPSEIYAVLERCFERRQLQDERRSAHEALRRAKEDAEAARGLAEAASQAKSEFLATMSHELRTPLNAVIGFSQIMMTETLGPIGSTQYRDYAKDIHDSGVHLLEIINDILDLSKAEAGKLELDEDWVDVGDAVSAACRLIGPRAERAQLSVVERIPANLPPLWADERKLKQILLNLVSNSVKFTPAGGRVEVSASIEPANGLSILVQDTGIGIPSSDLQRVLEPFVQVENSLTRSYQGSGLGLPLAAKMTELHGGKLSIASQLGRGTLVRLAFPAERIATKTAAAS